MSTTISSADRFWSKVCKTENCWHWVGTMQKDSPYGHFWHKGKLVRPHRFSYELLVGTIPEKLTIDHLCKNTLCVNPNHLEPVTIKENILRGDSFAAKNARKTHCKRGHKFTEKNTRKWRGKRICRRCATLRTRESRKKII